MLYKGGGLISVTSRILVVDMLQSDIPTDMITGILVLHAEKYVSYLFKHDLTYGGIELLRCRWKRSLFGCIVNETRRGF